MGILLVGTGNMGKEYAKVLSSLKVPYEVIGRGKESAELFETAIGKKVLTGGVENVYENLHDTPDHAIVAVGDYELYGVACFLIESGIKKILLEKPGGTSLGQLVDLKSRADNHGSDVFIAYNRRYYSSVEKALEIIEDDGGVKSFCFEFTEWIQNFEKRENRGRIEQVLYGNSGHVIDLAFFLGGLPTEMSPYSTGELHWEGNNRAFVGAGISEKGALFSYQANWDAPGRWGVEIMTSRHRLIFRPLEELKIQDKGSINVYPVEIDNELDVLFKPGLYREVEEFLKNSNNLKSVSISRQIENWKTYEAIKDGRKV